MKIIKKYPVISLIVILVIHLSALFFMPEYKMIILIAAILWFVCIMYQSFTDEHAPNRYLQKHGLLGLTREDLELRLNQMIAKNMLKKSDLKFAKYLLFKLKPKTDPVFKSFFLKYNIDFNHNYNVDLKWDKIDDKMNEIANINSSYPDEDKNIAQAWIRFKEQLVSLNG